MIEIYYIVAIAMSITNVYKKKIKNKMLIPLLSFMTIIVLHIINALLFDGIIPDAIKEAVMIGGFTIGIFNVGDMTGNAVHNSQQRKKKK